MIIYAHIYRSHQPNLLIGKKLIYMILRFSIYDHLFLIVFNSFGINPHVIVEMGIQTMVYRVSFPCRRKYSKAHEKMDLVVSSA